MLQSKVERGEEVTLTSPIPRAIRERVKVRLKVNASAMLSTPFLTVSAWESWTIIRINTLVSINRICPKFFHKKKQKPKRKKKTYRKSSEVLYTFMVKL